MQVAIGARVGRSVVHVALDEHSLDFLDCHRDALYLVRAGPVGRATEGHVERSHFDGTCCLDGTGNALLREVSHAIPVLHVVIDDAVGHERGERPLDVWHSHAQPMGEIFQVQDFIVTQRSQYVFTETDSHGIGVPGVQLTELSPEVGKGTPVSSSGLPDLAEVDAVGTAPDLLDYLAFKPGQHAFQAGAPHGSMRDGQALELVGLWGGEVNRQ